MKKLLLIAILIMSITINVKATSETNYSSRSVCSTFEVADATSSGGLTKVNCYTDFNTAKNAVKATTNTNRVILTKVGSKTRIIYANYGIVDFSYNPARTSNLYEASSLDTRQYTYLDTLDTSMATDGAFIDTAYSSSKKVYAAKVKFSGFTGWINTNEIEIVPLTWVKQTSYYTINSDIVHNFVNRPQMSPSGSSSRTIGPKPTMLSTGTYYSYDGHYFYTNRTNMLKDYKAGNYNNSVNKSNPYYNYYMYLSNHTKTNYSSINIDEYIRNVLGYTMDAYGKKAESKTSRLYGNGQFFYNAQQLHGANALLALSLSRNETGNGTSKLAVQKNNGFGLNAVDSNPYEEADWYASFPSSIMGFASHWITDLYANATKWHYFGPQYGNKAIGMNVKYASDIYWSEKMASFYYAFDKYNGLQDYNYYQLGIIKSPVAARSAAKTSAKKIYDYPEYEDAVVIVGEVAGESVGGSTTWYKVMSDVNIDSNYNAKSGNYNWTTYVYVPASYIQKINTPISGYKAPNSVPTYKDSNYTYDLLVENTNLKPRVAKSIKDTPFYYNSTLQTKTGKTLKNNRYVMVYAIAKEGSTIKSYLVTSDYFKDQKHWINADAITFVTSEYGKETVTTEANAYSWVNYNTEDVASTKISGKYTNSYFPILGTTKVGSNTWYKVPVDINGTEREFGYTLASAPDVSITKYKYTASNNPPVINASNKEIKVNTEFDPMNGVTATDVEDKDITNKITYTSTVNNKVVGTYKVTYKVTDSGNLTTTKEITVKVLSNDKPVINATDITIRQNSSFDPKAYATAYDTEDKDITNKIIVKENTVNTKVVGEYTVVYEVTDSDKNTTTKEVKVTVREVPHTDIENVNLDDYDERDGEFYLESLTWNNNTKKFTISGYLIVLNVNNIDKQYALVLKDKNSDKSYNIEIDSWLDNTPYDLGSENGKSYTESWFKGEIDLDITNGDYDLYMLGISDYDYTLQEVNNFFNKNIARRGEDNNHGYNFKVQQRSRTKSIELSIRDELYTTSTAPTSRNMVNGYDEISFKNNKLYMYAYSYDFDVAYNNNLAITRKVIFENTTTYEQRVFDVGCTRGPFTLETLDNKDKTYAWYEKELDISNLPIGNYNVLVYTKTANAANYDELIDLSKRLNKETTIDDKSYKIAVNKERNNRVELTIK
ncbi:MAG: DUF5011 domain-containing protein [Bacilli bacterium]|nr:DUF5011 domain-containing protein [Bacilli bacterium]